MKILYLCTYYHEALLYKQQKDALTKRGHTVKVFNAAKYGAPVAEKFKAAILDKDVVHEECFGENDRKLFFPRQAKTEKALLKAYNPKDFDLMHAHLMVGSGFTARRIKKKYGLKYVVSCRTTDLIGFIRLPFFHKLAVNNAKESSGILFLSGCHKDEFFEKFVPEKYRAEFEKKSVVIGNPLETFWEEHKAEPRKALREENKVHILLVGRINKVKRIPNAIEAVRILRDKGLDADLTVVGAVEDKEELEKISGIDFVNILPFMKPEELIKVYEKSDIFLLPSKIETFGRVYAEAISRGLPVVYTRGQGFDRVRPDGEIGYSVDCENPSEIAEKLMLILDNYAEISKNCIETAKDFYEDEIISKIEKFYTDSVNR